MRKLELAANLVFLSPFILGLVGACLFFTPLNIIVACISYLIGLHWLVQAKMSLFRQGIWFSFGPARLGSEYRRTYWTSYAFLAAGVFINIVAILVMSGAASRA
jgi:hypothetical protein